VLTGYWHVVSLAALYSFFFLSAQWMHVLQNARITCFLVHKCEWLGKRDVFEDVVVTDGRQVLDLTYIQPLIAFRL